MEASFHNYLNRSMNVLNDAGMQATMNQTEMNVFITELEELKELENDQKTINTLYLIIYTTILKTRPR